MQNKLFKIFNKFNINLLKNKKNNKFNKIYKLYNKINNCKKCILHKNKIRNVLGNKNIKKIKYFFIGEGPGKMEDLKGYPFIGKSGKLLNYLINKLKYKKKEIYITNVIKCISKNIKNKNIFPNKKEILKCLFYLKKEIKIIKPKIIITLGKIAFSSIFNINKNKFTIKKNKNKIYYYYNIPLISIYHPSYLLRNNFIINKYIKSLLFIKNIKIK
ncbi:putative uracil-DNA glycosylase, family 4 [Candidatus Zinderia insecticola CARI]|uniref:Type-4 uracil-DNA glycosylase n=1 Tax=Zinderia insecticola (strain CARI) TaxID=871271 RepID=E0TIS2_ZINIC|nr:putative uracil-DNA glycosylase, family 4 [Candidatus Zinderia insecticola CARI]